MNFYEVLELDSRASTNDIERAYRKLARKVHPDLNAGEAGKAEARMKLLNEIRDTLTDPLMRAGYDERLRLETLQRPAEAPPRTAPPDAEAPCPVPPRAASAPRDEPRRRTGPVLLAFGGAMVAGVLWFLREPRHSPPATADEPAPTEPASGAPPPTPGSAPSARVATSGGLAPLLPPSGLAVPVPRPRPGGAPRGVGTAATLGSPRGPFRGRGVVRIGSTADDVMRILGPPDSFEPGREAGDAVFLYGKLRLQMKNGRVVGGDAAARQ